MTRICSLYGRPNCVTTMVTTGSRRYLDSARSTSRATAVGSFPATGKSSTRGKLILPSGRTGTGTDVDRSGLRQTIIDRRSPGPIRYLYRARATSVGAGGDGLAQPTASNPRRTRQPVRKRDQSVEDHIPPAFIASASPASLESSLGRPIAQTPALGYPMNSSLRFFDLLNEPETHAAQYTACGARAVALKARRIPSSADILFLRVGA